MGRDDFGEKIRRTLALRVAYLCSNPECRRPTIGPHTNSTKAVNVGVAAHISAAAPGGPRYNSFLTVQERISVENGIWLCQFCSILIDRDELSFSKSKLLDWKASAEASAKEQLYAPVRGVSLRSVGELSKEINARFGFAFLYPSVWDRHDPTNNDGNSYLHPLDPRIEMRAWGQYAVLADTLIDWINLDMSYLEQMPSFRLVHQTHSGGHIVDFIETAQGIDTRIEQIEGYRVVYEIEQKETLFRVMQTFLQFGKAQFAVRCQAPSGEYLHYQELFMRLAKGIRVLGGNSASQARSNDN